MKDRPREAERTILAILSTVTGWVLLSNLPHHADGNSYARTTGVDFASPQPWLGVIFLTAGLSYFVLKYLKRDSDSN